MAVYITFIKIEDIAVKLLICDVSPFSVTNCYHIIYFHFCWFYQSLEKKRGSC